MNDVPLRDRIRSISAPKIELPTFDTDAAPPDPLTLLTDWLVSAIDAGVSQANAMTLSTAGSEGQPAARTVLLKDVTHDGLWFASLAASPKGAELRANPRAALTLYWREQGRQVRVTGAVAEGARAVSEGDFLARHPVARAQAIAGQQSEPLPDRDTVERLLASARELIQVDPQFVPEDWTAYVVRPDAVEFWQAVSGHDQLRLSYRRSGNEWVRERLWP